MGLGGQAHLGRLHAEGFLIKGIDCAMSDMEDVPEDFTKFTIERVDRLEDRLIIR